MKYLSKSDFKVAQSCPTKLFYKKQKYASAKDTNEYLALLADGGFMIGKLAQMLYPDGIEIVEGRGKQNQAIEDTERLLSENQTLINHKCVCGAQNRHFFVGAVSCCPSIFRVDCLSVVRWDRHTLCQVLVCGSAGATWQCVWL